MLDNATLKVLEDIILTTFTLPIHPHIHNKKYLGKKMQQKQI